MKHYMSKMRQSLLEGRFEEFCFEQLRLNFPDKHIPAWVYDALEAQSIDVAGKGGFIRDETVAAAADVRSVKPDRHEPVRDPSWKEKFKGHETAMADKPTDEPTMAHQSEAEKP